MKVSAVLSFLILSFLMALTGAPPADAQISSFEHIVIIVQENRTPDNLFYALCSTKVCSTTPDNTQYNIQTQNWLDKNAHGGVIQPTPVPLASDYGPEHTHADFLAMCDQDPQSKACRMDGAGDIVCKGNCPPNPTFKYVDNSTGTTGILDPYLFLAAQYGWANYMFQTNQGPSFPAHQFLFGATSAPSRMDDHEGTFAAENLYKEKINGCIAPPGTKIQLIGPDGVENSQDKIYPCFEHKTVADLLDKKSVTWRYYTPGAGDLWSAPDAISHICKSNNGQCTGPLWQQNVALSPFEVHSDISACHLRGVSWVIPSGAFSDHARSNNGSGPAWVASVVNAIGNSPCRNADNTTYWDSTAIIVVWDDWGGWYDHERPTFLPYPEGGYQYGFRVPLLFVSAYTPQGYINNKLQDFGSVVRFVENNFDIPMGQLTFADARTTRNLGDFYDFSMAARQFQTVPGSNAVAPLPDPKAPLTPPDDD